MAAGLDIAQSPLGMDGLFRHSGKDHVYREGGGMASWYGENPVCSGSCLRVVVLCPVYMPLARHAYMDIWPYNGDAMESSAARTGGYCNRCIGDYQSWLNCVRSGFMHLQRRFRHRAINAETRSRQQESALAEQISDKDRFRLPQPP